MIKILFVDDEANILTGLKRMLRRMRNEWEMTFCLSAKDALDFLQKNADYHIIVSDIRMPEMDGVELLAEIKKLYPGIIRILLSGHSDYDSALSSTRVAHQYLSKPCNSDILKNAIENATSLKSIFNNKTLQQIAASEDALPSPPQLYLDIVNEIESENGSIANIAKLAEQDIALTAKILQLVNSAFFGLPRNITSIKESVAYLGVKTLRGLVLMHEVFDSYKKNDASLDINQLWFHSMTVADLAKKICVHEGLSKQTQDNAFLAGMLHDIGTLLLAIALPKQTKTYMNNQIKGENNVALEHQLFGCSHAELGGYLLNLWGLPNSLVEAVVYHRDPQLHASHEIDIPVFIHCANAIAYLKPAQSIIESALIQPETISELNLQEKLIEWSNLKDYD